MGIVAMAAFGWTGGENNIQAQTTLSALGNVTFCHPSYDVRLHLNLQEAGVEVSGYEFLGAMKGYMCGRINGIWFLTKVTPTPDDCYTFRFASDQGGDTQVVRAKMEGDSVMTLTLEGHTYLRRVEKRKYVKFPQTIKLKRCK